MFLARAHLDPYVIYSEYCLIKKKKKKKRNFYFLFITIIFFFLFRPFWDYDIVSRVINNEINPVLPNHNHIKK